MPIFVVTVLDGKSNTFNLIHANSVQSNLDQELIKIFVVDHESLILIFQPYSVGGFADGPFTVKIPFTELIGNWQRGNPLEKQLPIKNFLSFWDSENWLSISRGRSITN